MFPASNFLSHAPLGSRWETMFCSMKVLSHDLTTMDNVPHQSSSLNSCLQNFGIHSICVHAGGVNLSFSQGVMFCSVPDQVRRA